MSRDYDPAAEQAFHDRRAASRRTYRLTAEEYARYLTERDGYLSGCQETQAALSEAMRRVRAAKGKRVTDGTHATVTYDAGEGFYYVTTTLAIEWV